MIKKYKQYNESIRSLLVGPTDEEMMSEYKKNPKNTLEKWIKIGYIKGVKLAIEDGVDLNGRFTIYLTNASLHNQVEITKLLLDNGIEFSNFALKVAYRNGYTEIRDLILKKFNLTFEKYTNKYPDDYLYLGVYSNNIDYVKNAIKLGADVNPKMEILLYHSVIKGYNKVAICLILHGATIKENVIRCANEHNPEISELLKNY